MPAPARSQRYNDNGHARSQLLVTSTALAVYLATSWFLSRVHQPLSALLVALVAGLVWEQHRKRPELQLVPNFQRCLIVSGALAVVSIAMIYVMVRLRSI